MRIHTFLLITCLLSVGEIGCSTIQSTMLHRGEMNDKWYVGPKSKGVPTTLKVITHLRVEVIEHHFLNETDHGIDWMEFDRPIRSVKIEPVTTDRIVMVDPKRPASGTLTQGDLTFGGQYLTNLAYEVDDNTIEDITAIVKRMPMFSSVLTGTSTSGGAPTGESVDAKLQTVDSVVAWTLLNVDEPDFECQLQTFLNRHLSGCHNCGAAALDILAKPNPCASEKPCCIN